MSRRPILGTRGSPLALAQARLAAAALEAANGWEPGSVVVEPITTTGDRIQDRPLADLGGKALWTKELDRALLAGATDFSVHSCKDIESERPEALCIAAVLPRADVRDRLIGADSIAVLKPGAVVGTSSPRRAAQIKALRPDVTIVPIRGNVATRLAKVDAGEFDATLLAAAGLDRLGLGGKGVAIPVETMLPAPTQAAIALECRTDDAETMAWLAATDHRQSHTAVEVERAFTRALGGNCHSPVAALAVVDGDGIWLRAELFAEDGSGHIADEARLGAHDIEAAAKLAVAMLERAPQSVRRLFEAE